MYDSIINQHNLKSGQTKNHYHDTCSIIIKMAKRLKLDLTEIGFVNDKNHYWWNSPFPLLVTSLYKKRFGKNRHG